MATIRLTGFAARRLGKTVYDVEDETEVRVIVEADPAVTSGVMTAELRPFRLSIR